MATSAPPFFETQARQTIQDGAQEETLETFVLPVFPSRKSVRVPSEALTLNLYEPRYLDLAEYVLKHEPRWFGALYCSKKPQLIRGGEGPITPMVEPGDIGVVCSVLFDEDAMTPIFRNSNDGRLRRRIKLKGLAIGRFRIEKVLQNGYGGGLLCDQDESIKPLPFILVEASRVDDMPEVPGTEEDKRAFHLEEKLFRSFIEKEGMQKKMVADLWGSLVSERDDVNLAARSFEVLLPSHLKENGNTSAQESHEMEAIEKALSSWAVGSSISFEDQRHQIFSFAVSSAAAPEKPANDALVLLRCTSTYDRLRYAYDELQRSQSWLSIFSNLL